MPIGKLCVVIRHLPYGREDAFAGLRTVDVCTRKGVPSNAVVTGPGVWNLVKGHRSESIGLPSNYEAAQAILDGGSSIYVDIESLEAQSVSTEDILEGVTVLPFSEIAEIILGHDAVLPLCGGF
jgi:sulfur relay (sulfurtransferase) DsrF/TusC family protein